MGSSNPYPSGFGLGAIHIGSNIRAHGQTGNVKPTFASCITEKRMDDIASNFCANCGESVAQEDKFCPGCGKSLVLASLAAEIPSNLDIGQPHPQPQPYLRGNKAGIIGGMLLFIGFILLYGVIITGAISWVFIPLIIIVLGTGLFFRI